MEPFPNLPEDIGRQCLLRVSYKSHYSLRAVCKSWESVVNSPRFYDDRKSFGVSEQRICLIQAGPIQQSSKLQNSAPAYGVSIYDPARNVWEQLPPIPTAFPLFPVCVSFNQKLVLFGGWDSRSWKESRTVYIYDFSCNRWQRGADMPTLRCFCACSVSPCGVVYVAGGHDDNKNALRGAEVYDVENNAWEILPDMNSERDECRGALVGGKFYVISGYKTQWQGRFERSSEVFDPETKTWTTLENMWSVGGSPECCVWACVCVPERGRHGI